MTQDSLSNYGASIGFFPDTTTSIGYNAAADSESVGEYNNVITDVLFTANGSYSGTKNAVNSGRYERMLNTSFDPATLSFASTNAASCNSAGKSYSVTNVANVLNYYIMATIPLRILHDVFRKLPLMRNAYFRIILNTNCQSSSSVTVTGAGGATYSTYSSSSQNGVLPFQISPLGRAGFTAGAAGTFVVSLGITRSVDGAQASPHMSQCRLYACLYTFSPLAEQRYFSSTKKKILYNDLYSYTIFNVPAGGNFSEIITNGIARPRYLLIYPMLAAAAVFKLLLLQAVDWVLL